MLAKVPRPGKSFTGLRRYLLLGSRDTAHNPSRVAFVATRNLATDDPVLATKIMTATAALSVRTVRPVYHLVISFHPDEQPSEKMMHTIAQTTLTDLGLADHQAVLVGHADTANRHLHLLINRVHPDTGRAWSAAHDYRRLEQSMQRQAQALGLMAVPSPERTAAKVQSKQTAKPNVWDACALQVLRQRLQPVLANVTTWSRLHEELAALDLKLLRKGQGFIVTDREGTGYAKFSDVAGGVSARDLRRLLAADHTTTCTPPPDIERNQEPQP